MAVRPNGCPTSGFEGRKSEMEVVTMLGTTWTAPNEGSSWNELIGALGRHSRLPDFEHDWDQAEARTNLKLTGDPIQAYDRQRWESGNVE